MEKLSINVGFAGIRSIGRPSFNQIYLRLVVDKLKSDKAEQTCIDLAMHMNLILHQDGSYLVSKGATIRPSQVMPQPGQTDRDGLLIHQIKRSHFNVKRVPLTPPCWLSSYPEPRRSIFFSRKEDLPAHLSPEWGARSVDEITLGIIVVEESDIQEDKLDFGRKFAGRVDASAAGANISSPPSIKEEP